MTKRSSTKYYKQFYPTTRRPHWSRSENQRAFLFGLFFELVLVASSREDGTLCVAHLRWHCLSSFVASHDELSQCLYPGKAWPWWWRLFDFTSSQVSLSLSAIPLTWRLFSTDFLGICWARTEFKVIPLFCNAQFYSASFFQDGGLPHWIDGMGYFWRF